MSKFFRSGSSDSSSSSNNGDSETDEISRDNHHNDETDETDGLALPSLDALSVSAPANADKGFHKDMLLHALLEERCMNDVLRQRSQRGSNRSDDASIQEEARARYLQLVARLAPNDLIASGFENDSLSPTRQRYREGLDYLSRTVSTPQRPNVPPPLRRLLTEGDVVPSQPSSNQRQLINVDATASALTPLHPVLEPSRYLRDFEELGVLGKGGYGVVYHVKHRLDSIDYAVKKLPISASRMARIQTHGQRELDELLRELRTLAKLDHPNIVRYFGGWIEWSDVGTSAPRTSRGQSGQGAMGYSVSAFEESETGAGTEESDLPLRRVFTQSGSDDAGIVFEQSLSGGSSRKESATAPIRPATSTSTDGSPFLSGPQPALALHLQMGLYPLNLADFISPSTASTTAHIAPLKHCFHLQPSISILLALLDGVEYLHTEGIVHRDLKPANIFLAANSNPSTKSSSVDLFICNACRAAGQAQPFTLKVRIGDFGLVTAISHLEEFESASSGPPVGTALYHPLSDGLGFASPRLDIYALGIIAFELLWPFETRMERLETLRRLKQGEFPKGFGEAFGRCGIEKCIREMLSLDQERDGIAELRKRLVGIAEAEYNVIA